MKVLFIESFYGGSHKDFALGFKEHSRHEVRLVTLPDRFWKWRMRGSSLYFVNKVNDLSDYDAIFTTDMLNLTDLQAIGGKNTPPALLYFHENQLSYPLKPGQKHDLNLSFINIASAVAANKVLFNSKFHFIDFINAATRVIKQVPDAKPEWMIEQIRKKTQIVYPGCRFETGIIDFKQKSSKKPLIIWNHRWDYDKNFEFVFDVLGRLKEKNIPFSLALLGERFKKIPDAFKKAKDKFKDEIVVFDYVESRGEYAAWLKKGSIVVSSAIQENFGIAVVEAVRYGCIPLLPERLSYPELMPKELHPQVLYHTKNEMYEKLEDMIVNYQTYMPLQKRLSRHMEQFSWRVMVKQYDDILQKMKTNENL